MTNEEKLQQAGCEGYYQAQKDEQEKRLRIGLPRTISPTDLWSIDELLIFAIRRSAAPTIVDVILEMRHHSPEKEQALLKAIRENYSPEYVYETREDVALARKAIKGKRR